MGSRGAAGGGRRRHFHPVTSLTDAVAIAGTVYGATLQPYDNGYGPIQAWKSGAGIGQALKEASPTFWVPSGSPGAGVSTGKKATIATSVAIGIGGRIARHFIRAPVIKLGKTKVRLWG